ncbi:acyl carrier protein [Actinospica durhamensis]|uniref:Acyl carrier protein n=1 Tax=Actinospica durhamensis TaxID=1508375 RepID=A0A941EHX5_9ACTN|nr:acyl carrier protein [Actinospica durhamensis]MBR7831782.1 acyl carrier protein [Actinospica durhamensis]
MESAQSTLDARLQAVFTEVFNLGPEAEPASLQYRDHPRWDSLGHMTLIVAVEREFEVEVDPDQLIRIESFDTALVVLRELGVEG